MKSHVLPVDPAGGWADDADTRVDPLGPRAARHRNLLRAVLLFHSRLGWDAPTQALWKQLTGKDEATTRTLCDAIRESGLTLDGLL